MEKNITDYTPSRKDSLNAYRSACEAHELLLDAMDLTDSQKALLRGSIANLLELQRDSLQQH